MGGTGYAPYPWQRGLRPLCTPPLGYRRQNLLLPTNASVTEYCPFGNPHKGPIFVGTTFWCKPGDKPYFTLTY